MYMKNYEKVFTAVPGDACRAPKKCTNPAPMALSPCSFFFVRPRRLRGRSALGRHTSATNARHESFEGFSNQTRAIKGVTWGRQKRRKQPYTSVGILHEIAHSAHIHLSSTGRFDAAAKGQHGFYMAVFMIVRNRLSPELER